MEKAKGKSPWQKVPGHRGISENKSIRKYRARVTRTMPDSTNEQFTREAKTLSDAIAYWKELKADAKAIETGMALTVPRTRSKVGE